MFTSALCLLSSPPPFTFFSILEEVHTLLCANFKSHGMQDRHRKVRLTITRKIWEHFKSLPGTSKIICTLFHISINNEFPGVKLSILRWQKYNQPSVYFLAAARIWNWLTFCWQCAQRNRAELAGTIYSVPLTKMQ